MINFQIYLFKKHLQLLKIIKFFSRFLICQYRGAYLVPLVPILIIQICMERDNRGKIIYFIVYNKGMTESIESPLALYEITFPKKWRFIKSQF